MVHKIALFNHKEGFDKATTTFNLGCMLAQKGKTVILVDTDPQCNLTATALGSYCKGENERLEETFQVMYSNIKTGLAPAYEETHQVMYSNIKTGLAPAFESQPKAIQAVDCIPIKGQERLFLLPGGFGFDEYEILLGMAQDLRGSIQSLKNLPGSISDLLEKTANKFQADYILIDMSPSLGAINQNLLTTSNFFIVPTTADFLSYMAIDSLVRVLPKWDGWAKKASKMSILREATYPFPEINLRFLGIIVQFPRTVQFPRDEKKMGDFQEWIKKIQEFVSDKLVPVLEKNNMTFSGTIYNEQKEDNFTLANLAKVTIFDSEECKKSFSDLADKIIKLTSAL